MSSPLAIAAVAALFFVLLAPLAFAAWKGANTAPVAATYVLLLSPITAYQSGLFSRGEEVDLETVGVASSSVANSQCAEILSLLDRAGAIIERRRPSRLVVDQDRWHQIPATAQEVVVACVQRSWPSNADAVEVETR